MSKKVYIDDGYPEGGLYEQPNMPNYAVPGIPDTEVRNVDGEDSRVNLYEAKLIDDFGSIGETMVKDIGSGDIGPDGKRRFRMAGPVSGAPGFVPSGDFEFGVPGTFAAQAKMIALKRKEAEDERKQDKIDSKQRTEDIKGLGSFGYKAGSAWDTYNKIKTEELLDEGGDYSGTFGPDGAPRYEKKDSRFFDLRKAENRIQETEDYKDWKISQLKKPFSGSAPKYSDEQIAEIKAGEQKVYDDAGVANLEEYKHKQEVFKRYDADINATSTKEGLGTNLGWRQAADRGQISQVDEFGSFTGGTQHRGTGSGQSVAQEMGDAFYEKYGDDVQFNEQGLPIPPESLTKIGTTNIPLDESKIGTATAKSTFVETPGVDYSNYQMGPDNQQGGPIPEGFRPGPTGDIRLKDKDIGLNLIEDARGKASTEPTLQMKVGGEEAGSIKQFMEETGMDYTPENFEKWQNYELPTDLDGDISTIGADTWADAQEFTGLERDAALIQNTEITKSFATDMLPNDEVEHLVDANSAGNTLTHMAKGAVKNKIMDIGIDIGGEALVDAGMDPEAVEMGKDVYAGAKTVKSAYDTIKAAKAAKDVGTVASGSASAAGAAGGGVVPGISIATGAFQMLTADEPEDQIAGGVTAIGGALMFTPFAPLGAVMVAGSSLWSIFSG